MIANMVMQTQIKKLLIDRQELWQRIQKVQTKKKDEDVKGGSIGKTESVAAPPSIMFRTPSAGNAYIQKNVFFLMSSYRNDIGEQLTR